MTTATTTTNAAHRQGSAHVIARGASGRLFYESYAGEFTDIATTAKDPLFLLPDIIRWRRLLETRGRLLKLRGLHLYILIAPDAHFIYRDEVPPHIVLPSRSPAQQFTELFSGIDNVTIINPEKALIAARGGIDVYKVNDTHWSAHGAFVAYRCLLDALAPGTPMRPLTAGDVSYRPFRSFGDLGALVDPEVTVDIPVASVRDGNSRSAYQYAGEGRNAWNRFESSRGRGHAFIPRDSFATELGIFVNETFARVDWVGGTSRLHLEAIDEEKPDVVIWQLAARLGGYRLVDTRIVGKPTGRANQLRSQRELAVFGDVGGEYTHAQSCRPARPVNNRAETARPRASFTRDSAAPDA